MKKAVILIPLIAAFLIGGCSQPKESSEPPKPSVEETKNEENKTETPKKELLQEVKNLESIHLEATAANSYTAKLEEYNLGKEEYKAQSGKIMPFEIRGVMAMPEGEGTFPLVVVIHGSHANENANLRFDTGFNYLIEKLAQNGYGAVSLDVSSAYQWKYGDGDDQEKILHIALRHLELLKEANAEGNSKLPLLKEGSLDLDHIILIGHSRGGAAVFSVGMQEEVEGILSIAPTLPADSEQREWPQVDTSIIVPEYDGDVVSLDGFSIQSILEKKNEEFSAVTLLRKANHNYFNSNLEDNDSRLARTEEELSDQISKEEQQQFLVNYAIDFCNTVTREESEELSWYENKDMLPETMYGLEVINRIGERGEKTILSKDNFAEAKAINCTLTQVKDSWFFEKDEVGIDTLTFGEGAYQVKDLLQATWEQEGAGIALPIKEKDFTDYDSLVINMVTDPTSALNLNNGQSFSILIKDTQGNECHYVLPSNMGSLTKTVGKMDMTEVFDKEIHFFSKPSPISSIRINLDQSVELDWKNISSVEIYFDSETSGSIFMEAVLLD